MLVEVFCIYSESKETTFSSVVYDRFADIGFGIQGNSLHTRSVLHNDREDVFTITSQPISKEVGLHVEELITSTMVWIEKEQRYRRVKTCKDAVQTKNIPTEVICLITNDHAIECIGHNHKIIQW